MGDLAVSNPDFVSGGFLTNIFSASYSTAGIELMTFCVIFIHALFSSIMLPMLKGGHLAGSIIHFIAMMWIGSVGGFMAQMMIGGLMAAAETICSLKGACGKIDLIFNMCLQAGFVPPP